MNAKNDISQQKLRDKTIVIAIDILNNDGEQKLTMRNMANKLGYSAAFLYKLFDNFDDICRRVNEKTLILLLATLTANNNIASNATQQLLNYGKAYINFAISNHNQWSFLFTHRSQDGTINKNVELNIQKLFSLITNELKKLNASADECQLSLAARTLWSSVHGIAWLNERQKLFTIQDDDSEKMLNILVYNFVNSWQKEEF